MKIGQTECEKTTIEPAQKQQHQISVSTAETSSIGIDSNVATSQNENAPNNNEATTTKANTKMTDERNSNSNSNNDRIVAETAKNFIKNGLNGTSTVAAPTSTYLSGATFQHPGPPPSPSTSSTATRLINLQPPPAHSTIISSPLTNNSSHHTPHRSNINNGLGSSLPGTPYRAIKDIGVIDYTVNPSTSSTSLTPSCTSLATVSSPAHKNHKLSGNFNHNATSGDIGRNTITTSTIAGNSSSGFGGNNYGGRLQFFKDGKFILELACSKDGEKSGWVSVPRKVFRSPSTTSSTVTPTSATLTAYPKNESSTSLSFSDDNSSIQSSPWQRDHCWKQTAPRRGISKEMSLYYLRPKDVLFTSSGLLVAHRKRRKPYHVTTRVEELFEYVDKSDENSDKNSTLKADSKPNSPIKENEEKVVQTQLDDHVATETKNLSKNGNLIIKEEDDCCSSSSTATLTGNDCLNNIEDGKTPTPSSPEIKLESEEVDIVNIKIEKGDHNNDIEDSIENTDKTLVEKMNTSEDDEAMSTSTDEQKQELNGNVKDKSILNITSATVLDGKSRKKGEEKRLKKCKIRAKLTTIIQKLIDSMPARLVNLSKVPLIPSGNSSGAIHNHNNSHNKVSPPSSTTTSRLVEYHQQHVSPRKRILREFEKVTLEDNVNVAGGKRSRAKVSSVSGGTARSVKSPPPSSSSTSNRLQSTGGSGTISSTNINAIISNNSNNHASVASTKTKTSTSSSVPTRLYSSYSIHSLLGGSNTSSSSSKKINDQAIVSNINYHQQQQIQNYTDPSYLRAMLASPKSPENSSSGAVGGKSPSNTANKKRSPPYASPMHETHSRSPVMAHISNEYGRRSPRSAPSENSSTTNNYKLRFAAERHSASPNLAHSPSHHLQQNHGFYSPYMTSPKYVPAPSTLLSPSSSSTGISRSPRSSSSAFSLTSSTSAPTPMSSHIPNSSSSISSTAQRDLSPPRSSSSNTPRETTPRTVPKKTASIRRQFASPTASNCPSPNDRTSDDSIAQQQDRKTPVASTASHLLQRGSPSGLVGATPESQLHYYMYQPPPSSHRSSNPHSSANVSALNNNTSAYIPSVMSPSYYNPYLSTLAALRHNPMWMHYPGAASPLMSAHHPAVSPSNVAGATTRLSSFQTFPYNGVGAAALAAAAAFGGSQIAPLATHIPQNLTAGGAAASAGHHHHHHMLTSGAMIHGGLMLQPPMNTGSAQSPKQTDNTDLLHATTTSTSALKNIMATPVTDSVMLGEGSANTIYSNSDKDEQSSDVPLNLSKH